MAMQLGALHDALLEAGASPEAAGRAAEELAGYEGEFKKLDHAIQRVQLEVFELKSEVRAVRGDMDAGFAAVRGEMDVRFARIDGELNLLKWMLGPVFALLVAIGLKIFLRQG